MNSDIHKDKNLLLPIGNISRQTGVSIKSLRYYDRIGILRPAYVDPETGYRYYDFTQIRLVEAIQLCVELDIPLSQFDEFLTEDKKTIRYGKLIAYGSMLADEKIKAIDAKLHLLDEMRNHLHRAENYRYHNGPVKLDFPEKYCWVVPFEGTQRSAEFHLLFNRSLENIIRHGLRAGAEAGLLMICRGEREKRYLSIDIETENGTPPHVEGEEAPFQEILHLPAATYVCMKTDHSNIREARTLFADLFRLPGERIVVESELFPNHYDFSSPHYELRCSLP